MMKVTTSSVLLLVLCFKFGQAAFLKERNSDISGCNVELIELVELVNNLQLENYALKTYITKNNITINNDGTEANAASTAKPQVTVEIPKTIPGLENAGQNCWDGCNQQQGKCSWCGPNGYCCKDGESGNGCDGSFGGVNFHACTLNTKMNGACKISFREPGESVFSPIPSDGILKKHMLVDRGILYHDNTKTYDTFRYAKTNSLPLTTKFTDSMNVEWQVQLATQSGTCTMCVPSNTEMLFWGDERDRVGMDATTQFMCFTFWYEPSSWFHSHGIRVRTEGFTDPKYANNDWDNWSKALDLVKKGTDIVSAMTETGIAIAGVARDRQLELEE